MENLKFLIKSFFSLDSRHFKECDPRSESLIFMMILAVFCSPMVFAIGIGVCIFFFLGSRFISLFFGLFLFLIAFLNGRSLINNISNGAIAFTLAVSVISSALLMIPLKLTIHEKEYIELCQESNTNKLKAAESRVLNEFKKLHEEEKELRRIIQQAADSFEDNTQSLADGRRNLKAFQESLEDRKTEIQTLAISESGFKENLDLSKIELLRFFVTESFSMNGSGENIVFWIQFFLIFLIESSPGLIALGLRNSYFSKGIEYDIETKRLLVHRRANLERDMAIDETKRRENRAKISVLTDMLKNFGSDKFDSTDYINAVELNSSNGSNAEPANSSSQNGASESDDSPRFKY